jgi:hypothetical protein
MNNDGAGFKETKPVPDPITHRRHHEAGAPLRFPSLCHYSAIARDSSDNVYVAGVTFSGDFLIDTHDSHLACNLHGALLSPPAFLDPDAVISSDVGVVAGHRALSEFRLPAPPLVSQIEIRSTILRVTRRRRRS